MSTQEIITLDYAHLVNSKAHLEALHFSNPRTENARLEALFHIQESIRWLDGVRVHTILSRVDFLPTISAPERLEVEALA